MADGVAVASIEGAPCPVRFDTEGTVTLQCASQDRTNAVTVTVVAVEGADNFPVWRGKMNPLSGRGEEFDCLSVSVDGDTAISEIARENDGYNYSEFVPPENRPSCMAFEVANPDASVVGSVGMSPFSAYYTLERAYYVVAQLPDGTRIVENRLSAFDIPPGLSLRMTSSSGVSFADGSARLTIAAEDFDEIGDFSYQFLVPEGVNHPCQFLRLLKNGKVVSQ